MRLSKKFLKNKLSACEEGIVFLKENKLFNKSESYLLKYLIEFKINWAYWLLSRMLNRQGTLICSLIIRDFLLNFSKENHKNLFIKNNFKDIHDSIAWKLKYRCSAYYFYCLDAMFYDVRKFLKTVSTTEETNKTYEQQFKNLVCCGIKLLKIKRYRQYNG